jgi:hypothetical protein
MRNLLESINDSILEDSTVEDIYYECLAIEKGLYDYQMNKLEAKYKIKELMESGVGEDLISDVLNGGPFPLLESVVRKPRRL